MELRERVALVTGAGAGIGRAAALALARAGAKVGVLDSQAKRAERLAQEITGAGGEALPLEADVSDAAALGGAVDRLGEAWGRIDVLFANAGINGVWAPLEEMEPEEWDQLMNVNLKGTFLSLKFTIPYLKQRGGSVIITSSVQGTSIFSIAGSTAYACTKAAQATLAKKAALELARDRIRVNAIRPGPVATSIAESTFKRNTERITVPIEYPAGTTPLLSGASISAEHVGELVLFLASDRSAAITGGEFLIDAGASLVMG